MKFFGFIIALGFLLIGALLYMQAEPDTPNANEVGDESATTTDTIDTTEQPTEPDPRLVDYEAKPDLIQVTAPEPGEVITSPLTITGEARGYWFFEASFPVVLVNWDGLIIAEGYATAEEDWMTEEFVPFTATLSFSSPYAAQSPDFMQRGALILQKDNPSGLPENDDALEIPINFRQEE